MWPLQWVLSFCALIILQINLHNKLSSSSSSRAKCTFCGLEWGSMKQLGKICPTYRPPTLIVNDISLSAFMHMLILYFQKVNSLFGTNQDPGFWANIFFRKSLVCHGKMNGTTVIILALTSASLLLPNLFLISYHQIIHNLDTLSLPVSISELAPSRSSECHFPAPYQGDWLLFERERREEVTISAGNIIFSQLGTFICKSKHWEYNQYKLLSVYNNGW